MADGAPVPVDGSDGLIYVDDAMPGISRDGPSRYRSARGRRITDERLIARLDAVGLPPAYTDCWYCPGGNGHILATGYDARGRKQYRYHPDFRAMRDSAKFDGCAEFGHILPLLRARVDADLARRDIARDRAIASVVRLLDSGQLRVGNEAYVKANKSHGATTLRMRHARLTAQKLTLNFRAKSGKDQSLTITDRSLLRFVRQMQDLPGQHLFQFVDGDGVPNPVTSTDVNDYIRDVSGGPFTAKHFRTWRASAIAFELIAGTKDALPAKTIAEAVAAHLGNTPTIARKSYIHPALLDNALALPSAPLPRQTRWMTRAERGLLRFLDTLPAPVSVRSAA